MAAKTLEEHLKQALFVTRIEELAFAFGWNAAMNNLEGVQTQSTNKQSTPLCSWCGKEKVLCNEWVCTTHGHTVK